MVGCGETETEVIDALRDLLDAGCDAVTLSASISSHQADVLTFTNSFPPEQFARYEKIAV
jgi:lipoate synthase